MNAREQIVLEFCKSTNTNIVEISKFKAWLQKLSTSYNVDSLLRLLRFDSHRATQFAEKIAESTYKILSIQPFELPFEAPKSVIPIPAKVLQNISYNLSYKCPACHELLVCCTCDGFALYNEFSSSLGVADGIVKRDGKVKHINRDARENEGNYVLTKNDLDA